MHNKGGRVQQLRTVIARGAFILVAATILVGGTASIANAAPARSATPAPATTHKPEITPDAAAQVFCRVNHSWQTSCKTAVIPVLPSYFEIFYNFCAAPAHYADYQIKDQDTGVIVKQGRVPAGGCTGLSHVGGLYGAYWGWVFNTRIGASAYLSNFG
jgi:hypothetical protein